MYHYDMRSGYIIATITFQQAFAIDDVEEQKDEINFYVAIICVVGVFAGLFTLGMVYFFGYSGEKLTLRLRVLAFRTMLSQVGL